MKTTSFGIKAALVASMILTGQSFAQSLPDEINHPKYKSIFEDLQVVLNQKITEYNKLADRKEELEQQISVREEQQAKLPARNAELKKLIDDARAEIAQIDNDIQGLTGIMAKVDEDVRRLNNEITQLQAGLNQESNNNSGLAMRRNQVAQVLAQKNAVLQREVDNENQAITRLNNLDSEQKASADRLQDVQRERIQLQNDVNRFKTEIVSARNTVNQNNNNLAVKKPLLADAQAKIGPVQADIASANAQLAQIDVTLNPKKTQLNALKAELGRLSPDIARLQAENKTLEQKIASNNSSISALGVDAKIAKKNALESEIAGTKGQIDANTNAQIALQDKIKPTLGQITTYRQQQRDAAARRDTAEVARLKAEIDKLNASIEPDQKEIQRLLGENNRLALVIAPKQAEINQLNAQITDAQTKIAAFQADNNVSTAKIAENNKKITEQSQANAGLAKQIADLEAEIAAVDATRAPIAQKIATLRAQETQFQNTINVLGKDVADLENQNKTLNANIAQMEKTINEFPETSRRLEAHARQLDEKIRDLSMQINSQRQLVSRIQQNRVLLQRDRDIVQRDLDDANMQLAESDRLIANLRNKLTEQSRSRDGLVRYNQDNQKKLDGLNQDKQGAQQDIAGASNEINANEQKLATINAELPKIRSDLAVVNPQVIAADNARNNAQTNVNNANDQFQSRLNLYQRYLTESQAMGVEKASIGTADGVKAGSIDAKAKAQKLGSDSATVEGKWEALRRGYVRGEIAGFKNGFDIGMASAPDAERGDSEGRVAGAKRAKDQANNVIKPEKYLAELERRLRDDDTTAANKIKVAGLVTQELNMIKSMSMELQETIPDLSQAEIAEAARIVSSLDSLIAQADIEIDAILALRKNLAVARNVYTAPGAGENQNNANCSAVYKNVKDYVDACKGAYVIRYQNLYNTAHADTFNKEYSGQFSAQIDRVFDAELNRLYAGYNAEATKVGRDVGIATGKREIYQQNFDRAESGTYAANLPGEVSRVEGEAQRLVQEHLNGNAALTLKASPKLITSDIYGIAPGVDTDLKMLIKNVGSQASQGNSFVKIKELSGNLQPERREAPVTTVAANSHADLSIMKVRVSDAAVPGTKAIIAGEIVHPGNHYRSSRVEQFRIESVIAVNPSIEAVALDFDNTPDISNIFVTKKHDIDMKLKPKFAGVPSGYEVVVEEVGTNFVEPVSKPGITEVLGRGQEKKVTFTYKLNKASKGKTLTLKITVKNEGRIVSQQNISIQPK